MMNDLYHDRSQTWNLSCAKAPGLDDCKRVNISNMDPLAIVQPRELSHGLNSKFETGRGIHGMLSHIVASDPLHARWLNTVSYLENCGARKIAACEHPTLVKEEMLKHASEEFRHAHYLKSQIERVSSTPIPDYSLPNLIGGTASMHYLTALDLKTSRYLSQTIGLSKSALRAVAYLLVTYAIEVRAEEFYPVYDQVLRQHGSKVAVKSILLEEKEHLAEMREGLNQLPSGFIYAEKICAMESELYDKWLGAVSRELCS